MVGGDVNVIAEEEQERFISHKIFGLVHGVAIAFGRMLGDEGEGLFHFREFFGFLECPFFALEGRE